MKVKIISLPPHRINAGFKIGEVHEVMEYDPECPIGLIYRLKSPKTLDFWLANNHVELQDEE